MEQNLIWAMCRTNPGSSAIDTPLKYHQGHGGLILNLAKSLDGSEPSSTTLAQPTAFIPHHHTRPLPYPTTSTTTHQKIQEPEKPLLPYQRMIVAHAVFCVAGFMLLLPGGALLARYMRTLTPTWFTGHWVVQFALSGPVILLGVIMGQ